MITSWVFFEKVAGKNWLKALICLSSHVKSLYHLMSSLVLKLAQNKGLEAFLLISPNISTPNHDLAFMVFSRILLSSKLNSSISVKYFLHFFICNQGFHRYCFFSFSILIFCISLHFFEELAYETMFFNFQISP